VQQSNKKAANAATTDAEINVNFVTKTVGEHPQYLSHATMQFSPAAVHHQRAKRPLARHAFRLSQVIIYGVVTPQTFVH
jgi:hypothetical protein